MVLRPAWRETDAAIAHQNRRNAVLERCAEAVGPGDLSVVMCVDVDEAWRNQPIGRVDLLLATAGRLTDRDNQAVGDGYIADEGRGTGAVDDRAAANDQIVVQCHLPNLSFARRSLTRSWRHVEAYTTPRCLVPACDGEALR